jgi:hypothetical protein
MLDASLAFLRLFAKTLTIFSLERRVMQPHAEFFQSNKLGVT